MTDRAFKVGERVVAYGKYPATVKSGRLGFNAYEVETDPVPVPNRKRRKRVPMTVAASNLKPMKGGRCEDADVLLRIV